MSARTVLSLFLAVGATLAVSAPLYAQDSTITGWKKSLVVDLTGTQTAYSDSWVGGELGALSWVGNLNGMAEKQLAPSFNFQSRLKLSFGQTHTQKSEIDPLTGSEKKFWEKPKKSTDLIDWENVGRLTKGWVVDPYLAVRFESQFLDASNELKKRYVNPKKLTESAGIARNLYKRGNDLITSRFGFAFRQIIKNVIIDTLLNTTDSTLTDGGFESVTDVNLTLHKNIQYTGKLTLYKALFFSKKNEVKGTEYENYWKAVDVNWENIIAASITKLITVNLYVQFLYDKEVELRGRLKETLGIGFVYKLI